MLHTSTVSGGDQEHRAARMANRGHYFAAAVVTHTGHEQRMAALMLRQQQLEDEQQLQRQAFLRAKEQAQRQLSRDAKQRAASAADANATAMESIHTAHNIELALHAARGAALAERQAVPQAAGSLHLHRAEQRMALQKRYVEAAVLQELANTVQRGHEDVVHEQRQRQLYTQVNRHAQTLAEKERILEEGLRAKHRLVELRGTREMECGNARLAHMENDLFSTQARQRFQLKTMGFLPPTSAAQASKAQRGTQLEREMMSKTRVTYSLCETYGYLLDQ